MIPIDESTPPPARSQGVEERLLTKEEISRFVKPHYDRRGVPMPNPNNAVFLGVVEGGVVKAFLGLQVMLHAEPLVIEDGEARYLTRLVHKAEEVILNKVGPAWVYLFAPPGKVARLAELMGMQLEPWCVYTKLVLPAKPVVSFDERGPMPEDEPIDGIVQ